MLSLWCSGLVFLDVCSSDDKKESVIMSSLFTVAPRTASWDVFLPTLQQLHTVFLFSAPCLSVYLSSLFSSLLTSPLHFLFLLSKVLSSVLWGWNRNAPSSIPSPLLTPPPLSVCPLPLFLPSLFYQSNHCFIPFYLHPNDLTTLISLLPCSLPILPLIMSG